MIRIAYLALTISIVLMSVLNGFAFDNTFTKRDSLKIERYTKSFNRGSIIAGGLVVVGFTLEFSNDRDHWWTSKYAFQSETFQQIHDFTTTLDDYTQFAPLVIASGLIALNVEGENRRGQQTLRLISSEIMGIGTMAVLKNSTRRIRPDGSQINSFPSGHTTQAFIAARFLDKEFGRKHPWVKYTGYSLAAFTGVSRVLNNRHWMSDVLVGAGLGIISVDVSYWIFDKLEKQNIDVSPLVIKGGGGLSFSMNF